MDIPMPGWANKILTEHREGVMYVFFGGFTVIVNWLAYAILVWAGMEINLANILSWVIGVLFAFAVNKWFVFLSKSLETKVVIQELGSFIGARIVTGVIAMVLFPILYNIGLNQSIMGTDGLLAKIITSIIEIVLNWAFSKYIVFKKK